MSWIRNYIKNPNNVIPHASIFTAESIATYKVVKHLHYNTENSQTNYIILSDSFSCPNIINYMQNSTDVTKLIQKVIYRADEEEKQIKFITKK